MGTQTNPNLKFCFIKKSPLQNFIRKTLVFFKKKKVQLAQKWFFTIACYLCLLYHSSADVAIKSYIFHQVGIVSQRCIPSSTVKTQKKSGDYFLRGRLSCQAILKFFCNFDKISYFIGGFFFIFFMSKTNNKGLEFLYILGSTLKSWLTYVISWENYQFWLLCILFYVKIG